LAEELLAGRVRDGSTVDVGKLTLEPRKASAQSA
jgi:hypothetical protein